MPIAPDSKSDSRLREAVPDASISSSPVTLLDRDHSILAFNERVLDWACRPAVPLLERLRYLCIVSSNLDEFFEVRAEPHLSASQAGEHRGLYTRESFEALAAHGLESRLAHGHLVADVDLPGLAAFAGLILPATPPPTTVRRFEVVSRRPPPEVPARAPLAFWPPAR